MIGTDWEEQQKDKILQAINDELDRLNWGGGCDRLTVRIVFEGKFQLLPFHANQTKNQNPQTTPRILKCYQ